MADADAPPPPSGTQKAPRSRNPAPRMNLSDIPEMMPGAQPGANPAQRFDFEQRCRELHRDSVEEERQAAAAVRVARSAEHASFTSDLEAMFPLIDAALVRSLAAEAPSQQAAIEMLLQLSATLGGGEDSSVRAATPPPVNLGVEDHDKFPTLGGSPSRQPASKSQEQEQDEDLGSAWRDRAKAAAPLPAPRASWASALPAQRRKKEPGEKEEKVAEAQMPLTDWEIRQKAGQRRARRNAKYGRGGGKGGTQAARRRTADGEDSQSEASEDEGEEVPAGTASGRAVGERPAVPADGEDEDDYYD